MSEALGEPPIKKSIYSKKYKIVTNGFPIIPTPWRIVKTMGRIKFAYFHPNYIRPIII
jgi:hypothetical protein